MEPTTITANPADQIGLAAALALIGFKWGNRGYCIETGPINARYWAVGYRRKGKLRNGRQNILTTRKGTGSTPLKACADAGLISLPILGTPKVKGSITDLIKSHPQVTSLQEWKDDSGRSEGWAAHLIRGCSHDGCSFVRGDTLLGVAVELARITNTPPA